MTGRMIAFPGDENIATPANLTHDRVLPFAVSFVKITPWTTSTADEVSPRLQTPLQEPPQLPLQIRPEPGWTANPTE